MKITVEGMSCNHCRMSVEKAVRSVAGVNEATVSLEEKLVTAVVEPGTEAAVEQQIRTAITEAGYTPV